MSKINAREILASGKKWPAISGPKGRKAIGSDTFDGNGEKKISVKEKGKIEAGHSQGRAQPPRGLKAIIKMARTDSKRGARRLTAPDKGGDRHWGRKVSGTEVQKERRDKKQKKTFCGGRAKGTAR